LSRKQWPDVCGEADRLARSQRFCHLHPLGPLAAWCRNWPSRTWPAVLLRIERQSAVWPVDLALARRKAPGLGDVVLPEVGFEAITVMAGERRPIRLAVRVLGMSESAYSE
jgi:hypothetical protein